MKKVVLSTIASSLLAMGLNAGDLDFMAGKNFFDDDAKLKDSLVYGLRYSHYYQNTPWGAQLGFDRINGADVEVANIKSEVDANRYFLNALYELSSDTKLKTFLLGGLGYEDVDSNYAFLDSQMFANVGVGARYMISEAVSLVAEAKYIRKLEDDMNDFVLSLGLGYSFGASATKEAPTMATPVKKEVVKASTPSYHIEPKPKPVKVKVEPKDSDGDGVLDRDDMCPNTFSGTKVDQNGCPIMMKLHINFDYDKAEVKAIYENQIDKALSAMKIMPWIRATVVGHTDSRGSDSYNQKLSQARAEAVKEAMLNRGNLKKDRVTAIGKGEKEPVATNKTEEGMAQNRRVEVFFE